MENENEQLMFEDDLGGVFQDQEDGGEERDVSGVDGLDMAQMEMDPMDVTEETIQNVQGQDQGEGEGFYSIPGLDGHHFPLIQQAIQPPPVVVELTPEEQLRSTERLDRSSPDLWPQNLPTTAQQIISQNLLKNGLPDNLGIWAQGLDPEDINLLHQFGSLTSSSLVEEVKKLQNIAYQLGLDEAKEMTRGKLLHALNEEPFSAKEGRHIKRLWN